MSRLDATRAELVAARDHAWSKVTTPIDRTSPAYRTWGAAAHAVIDHDQQVLGIRRSPDG